MRDLGSLYFLIRHAFVCGTLFPGIKLNLLYPSQQSSTYKSAILAEIQILKVAELYSLNGTVNVYEYTVELNLVTFPRVATLTRLQRGE